MKKKINYLGLLGALLIASPSLMAASRYSEMNYEYSNFEVTVISINADSENEEYSLYDLNIKNTGNGYIQSIKYDEGDGRRTDISINDLSSPVTNIPLLKPESECAYEGFRWYKDDEFPKGSFTATAYDCFSFSVEENIGGLVKSEDEDDIYYFECTLPKLNKDYGYNYVATMEYGGAEHCFSVDYSKDKFAIRVKNTVFDISKASITKVDAFSYEIYRTNYAGLILGGGLYMFLAIFLPFIAICGVIVVVIRIRKKRRLNGK